MWVLFFGEINVVYYFITSLLKNCCSPLSFQTSQESFILLFHLHFFVFLLLHPCTQPKIKGIVSFVKLENFRHSFFILSFQPPIWYSFKLLSLPKTWDKADKDRNDRTIYNAEIFLVSIHFLFIQKAALNDLFLLLFKQQQQQKKDRRSKICNFFMWVLLKKKRLFQGGLIIDLNIS